MKVLELVKDIMDSMALLAQFTSKQRLTVLGAISALMIGLNQYPQPPQAAPAPVGQQAELTPVSASAERVLPNGYNPAAAVRDPFAMPAQYQQPINAAPVAGVGRGQQADKVREVLPKVQGIVGAGATKVAIIAVGADSSSYRINQRVGSYVITAITNNSVTLQGPEGISVVSMGR